MSSSSLSSIFNPSTCYLSMIRLLKPISKVPFPHSHSLCSNLPIGQSLDDLPKAQLSTCCPQMETHLKPHYGEGEVRIPLNFHSLNLSQHHHPKLPGHPPQNTNAPAFQLYRKTAYSVSLPSFWTWHCLYFNGSQTSGLLVTLHDISITKYQTNFYLLFCVNPLAF